MNIRPDTQDSQTENASIVLPPVARGKIDTSQMAADSLPNKWRTKTHLAIIRAIAKSDRGLIADELEVMLEMRACSLTARINELLKSGAIIRSGDRRHTRSRRLAHVYIVSPTIRHADDRNKDDGQGAGNDH